MVSKDIIKLDDKTIEMTCGLCGEPMIISVGDSINMFNNNGEVDAAHGICLKKRKEERDKFRGN